MFCVCVCLRRQLGIQTHFNDLAVSQFLSLKFPFWNKTKNTIAAKLLLWHQVAEWCAIVRSLYNALFNTRRRDAWKAKLRFTAGWGCSALLQNMLPSLALQAFVAVSFDVWFAHSNPANHTLWSVIKVLFIYLLGKWTTFISTKMSEWNQVYNIVQVAISFPQRAVFKYCIAFQHTLPINGQ